jgi:superfamily II DNA or RNA helicase
MEITEDWVRGLTGWKPFKEGKTIAGQGVPAGFKRTGELLQATFREGRLNLRTVVKIAGPTDVHVQCGCPDHRAGGGICAHAVALLLSAVQDKVSPSADPSQASPRPGTVQGGRPQAPARIQAWDLRFSPELVKELAAGRLAVRLLPSSASPVAADHRLTSWIGARGMSSDGVPSVLRLAGEEVGEFLALIAGHPRIRIDGRSSQFRIEEDPAPPLRLADSRLEDSRVTLELAAAPAQGTLVRWGDAPAFVDAQSARRLPARSLCEEWYRQLDSLASVGRLKLSIESFLGNLESWLDLLQSPQPGWLSTLRMIGAEPNFELELEGSLDSLGALLKIRYPGLPSRPLPRPQEPFEGLPSLAADGHLLARNPAAEANARRQLERLGFEFVAEPARYHLRGRTKILDFIADGLPDLRQQWTVSEGEGLAIELRRVHVVRPDIREISDFGGSLTFELSFQTTGGKRLPSTELRRLLRGGKRVVKLSSGADLVISRSCEELVNPLVEELGIGRPDEPFMLGGASAILLRNLRDIISGSLISSDESRSIQAVSAIPFRLGSNVRLRPYQAGGAEWIIDRLSRLGGCLLADEMGLGKTLQTIAAIHHFRRTEGENFGVGLIVAPTSLLGNWMSELKRFAPELKCRLFHGVGRDRERGRLAECDLIVTSYGTLARDLAFHLQVDYRVVVIDEASLIRNPDAEISRTICKLKSRARLALTGTPVENRARDLWSIFRFVSPGYLGALADFKERYEMPLVESGSASRGLLERLKLRVSPFVLRRTKDQVAKDLPDKVEIDEWLDMTEGQSEVYTSLARSGLQEIDAIRDRQGEGAGQMHLLTLLLRLRQVCVDPGLLDLEGESPGAIKIERLLELLSERFDDGRKTLVFSQFAVNLRRIEKRIQQGFGRIFCIDGSTRNRQELVEAFQAEPGPAVFLISLKAGGYGLNLTAADAVVHLDPWWNPAVEAQATDRAHRIGQSRPVTVYRLLTRGTVEERVRRMQERKRTVIDGATGDLEGVPRNWSAADLESLLA